MTYEAGVSEVPAKEDPWFASKGEAWLLTSCCGGENDSASVTRSGGGGISTGSVCNVSYLPASCEDKLPFSYHCPTRDLPI